MSEPKTRTRTIIGQHPSTITTLMQLGPSLTSLLIYLRDCLFNFRASFPEKSSSLTPLGRRGGAEVPLLPPPQPPAPASPQNRPPGGLRDAAQADTHSAALGAHGQSGAWTAGTAPTLASPAGGPSGKKATNCPRDQQTHQGNNGAGLPSLEEEKALTRGPLKSPLVSWSPGFLTCSMGVLTLPPTAA